MKKLLVTLLCVIMIMAMMPVMAFAETGTTVATKDAFIEAVANGGTVTLSADIDLGSDTLEIDKEVVIDGAGFEVKTTAAKAFRLYADATFKNLTIIADERCVDTRTTVDVQVINCELTAVGKNGYNIQPITISADDMVNDGHGTTFLIEDSVITSTADSKDNYPIIVWVTSDITIKNSVTNGWAGIYVKGSAPETEITIEGSTLNGINPKSGPTQAFGTVVIEEADDVVVDIIDSKIIGKATAACRQYVFMFSAVSAEADKAENCTVTVSGNSRLEAVANEGVTADLVWDYTNGTGNNDVVIGGGSVLIKEYDTIKDVLKEYFAEGVTTKKLTDGSTAVVCETHTYKNGACIVCETEEPVVEVEKVPTIDATKPVEKVEVGTNEAAKEVLAETSKEVLDAVVNGEEVKNVDEEVVTAIKEAVEAGDTVEVKTTVEATPVDEKSVDKADVVLVEKAADGTTIAQYLDLSVMMTIVVNGDEVAESEVTQLSKEVTFTIAVPKELKEVKSGYTREYYVIRVHDGKTDKLPVTVNEDGTLSFKTDRFSTYALAYVEKETPKTGDATTMMPWLAVMAVAAVGAVVFKKREN